MAYSLLSVSGRPHKRIASAAAFLRGYHASYPLHDMERQHMTLLVLVRLACSVALGAYSYHQNPANEYLLLHATPAWQALELLWGADEARRVSLQHALDRVWNQACDGTTSGDPCACHDLDFPDPSLPDPLQSVRVTNESLSTSATNIASSSPDCKKVKLDSPKPVITFVTGNKKKLEEVQRILAADTTDAWFTLHNRALDLPEWQGDVSSIAREKCRLASQQVQGPVLTEDTSLCFHALNGLPGPYIKWFLDSCGHGGLNRMLDGFDDRSAYAQTVVALSLGPQYEPILFDGRTEGTIVLPRGSLDFGWDPIFEPLEGQGKTYAEMSKDEKDAISHRSRAFAQLKAYLQSDQTRAMFVNSSSD
jgi:inosine triphosphate pyrophosphatase